MNPQVALDLVLCSQSLFMRDGAWALETGPPGVLVVGERPL